jgi:hypothetical protein
LRHYTRARVGCCIFEFLPQAFEIGIHGVASVQ